MNHSETFWVKYSKVTYKHFQQHVLKIGAGQGLTHRRYAYHGRKRRGVALPVVEPHDWVAKVSQLKFFPKQCGHTEGVTGAMKC